MVLKCFNKKWKIIAVVFAVLICTSMIFGIFAMANNTVTALESGFTDVAFSNGYRGYCLDMYMGGAYTNNEFTVINDSSIASSNIDSSNVSQKIKVLFTQHFLDLFKSDGNGGYVVKDDNLIQSVIWHLTDNRYIYGAQTTLFNAINAYTGSAIPDHGYKLTLDTGEVITFHFIVLRPNDAETQDFFAYYIEVTPKDTHTHKWDDEWSTDDNQHWHECDCGEKTDIANHDTHTVGIKSSDCINLGYTGDVVCKVCDKTITSGDTIPALGHDMGEWYQTIAPTCAAEGQERSDCQRVGCEYFETRDLNKLPHTEVIDTKIDATCTSNGKTEGKHCDSCGEVLVAQTTIPMLGHEVIVDKEITPTCTATGLTEGEHCSRCDYKVVQEVVPANGHTMSEWFIVLDATCTENGLKQSDCLHCDYFEADNISMLGHDMGVDKAVTPTCLTTGLTEGSHCNRCDYAIDQKVVDALGHDMGEWFVTKEATCTENGEERRECSRCEYFETRPLVMRGHTEVIDKAVNPTCIADGLTEGSHCDVCNTVIVEQRVVSALGHDMVVDKAVNPTCTETGLTEGSHCSRCEYAINQKIVNMLGHDMSDWQATKQPTCTENGIERSDCLRENCDYYSERDIAATGHKTFKLRAVAPTCTKTGLTEGVQCSVCNEILTIQEIVSALGHIETLVNTEFPTCADAGYIGDIICTRCNSTITVGSTVPALRHDMSEWYTTKNPTCTETGEEQSDCQRDDCKYFETREINTIPHVEIVDSKIEATCTSNGKTEGKHCDSCGEVLVAQTTIPMLGHDVIIDKEIAPTCTSAGLTEGEHCSRCDYKVAQEVVPANGHTMDKWFVVVEATCTENGLKQSDCLHCDYFETRAITMFGHTEVVDKSVNPTCVADGLTEGSHCDVCNTIIVEQKIVPALGHKEALVNKKAPTCLEAGYTGDIVCNRCESTLIVGKVIDELGHNIGEWYTVIEPTCITDGEEQRDCARCEHFETRIIVASHEEVVDEAVEPTCTTDGVTEGAHCAICEAIIVEQEVIPMLGHDFIVDEAIAPTCTETGLTEGNHCNRCDYKVEQQVAEALGHDMGEWYTVIEPTYDEDGLKERVCQRDGCDYKEQETIPMLPKPQLPVTGNEPSDNPQTGDSSAVGLYLVMMVVSLFGVAGLLIYNKKMKT